MSPASPPALNLSQHQGLFQVFSSESVLHIMWPKYWSFSFSISPSNEYSGLISFRIDWLDLFAVQGILESSQTPQFKSIDSSVLSFLYSPILTSIHDYWKNHSFDDMDLCQQSNVIAFLPRSKCLLTMSLNENIATHSMDISYRHDIEKEVSIHRMEYVILFL